MSLVEEDEKLRQFNESHDKQYSSPPLDLSKPQGTPGQSPSNLTPQEQRIMIELQAKMAANNPNMNVKTPMTPAPNPPQHTPPPTYSPAPVSTVGSGCPECGVMHPPLPPGQRCPNAKANLATISDVEIGEFLAMWRNIIISQIEKRQIKDAKKLFQHATLMLTKFLEEYKEEANVKPNPTKPEEKGTP